MKQLVQSGEFGRSVLERCKGCRVYDVIGSTLTQQTLVALRICNPAVAKRFVANEFEQNLQQ